MPSIWQCFIHKKTIGFPEHPLWSKEECRRVPARRKTRLKAYLLDHTAPAVILCPGGSYQMVSCHNEGDPIAVELNRRGFHAFVLRYRVGRSARYPAPMEDLAQAIRFIKSHSLEFQIDADRIILFGASAAGHLCSYFGARYGEFEQKNGESLRPHAIVLSYPVVNFTQETHAMTRNTLLGRSADMQELLDKSSDLLVTEDYPPTFLWHCEDDKCVPVSNSVRMERALAEHQVPHRYCQYPQGGHGIGLGAGPAHPLNAGWRKRSRSCIIYPDFQLFMH